MTRPRTVAAIAVPIVALTALLGGCGSSSSSSPHVGASATPGSGPSTTAASAFHAEVAAIRGAVRADLAADRTPGAVVVVRRGTRTRTMVFGYADRKTHARMRADDRFRFASITKVFTAATTLRLVAQGKLSLQDTVAHWLPGLLARGRDITVADLLGQTSGLPEYTTTHGFDPLLHAGQGTPRHVVELVADRPLLFEPGTESSYSNTNFTVLGLVLERVSHRPLGSLLQQQLFGPLHLRSATLAPTGFLRPPIAHGYLEGRDVVPDFVIGWAGGAAALVSSAPDVARFLDRLLSGDVVPPALLKRMETMRPMNGPDPVFSDYGLGLAGIPTSCGTAIGHGGNLPGFQTGAWATKDGTRSVVVATNSQPSNGAVSTTIDTAVSLALCSP